MVLLNACRAAEVMASASSNITILCLPGGRCTFDCANVFMALRTTFIPVLGGWVRGERRKGKEGRKCGGFYFVGLRFGWGVRLFV